MYIFYCFRIIIVLQLYDNFLINIFSKSELFKQFEREEQNRLYLTKYQVEEGELLIRENNAKKNLHDAKLINRNRRAVTEYNVRLIQKCCRKWLKRIRSRNRNKKKEEVEANTNDIDILI